MSADTAPSYSTSPTPHLSKFVDQATELAQRQDDLRAVLIRLEAKSIELDPMARGQLEDALTTIRAGLRAANGALDFARVKYLS